jgi:hypothetical protein
MSKFLSRDDILDAQDAKTVEVPVPEWDGVVLVKALNGEERDRYESSLLVMRNGTAQLRLQNAKASLVALAVVDESGKKLFTLEDVKLLGKKSASALDRIATVASNLAGLSEGDVTQLTANFTVDLNGGSTSN